MIPHSLKHLLLAFMFSAGFLMLCPLNSLAANKIFFKCGDHASSQIGQEDAEDANDATMGFDNDEDNFDLRTLNNQTANGFECKNSGGSVIAVLNFSKVCSSCVTDISTNPHTTVGVQYDSGAHELVMRNVRIDVDQAVTDLEISFWRVHSGNTGNHDYEARGGGYLWHTPSGAADNGALVFKAEVSGGATHDIPARSAEPPTSPRCAFGDNVAKCVNGTATYKGNFYWSLYNHEEKNLFIANADRTLKGLAWLTFTSSDDYAKFTEYSTSGLRVKGKVSTGGGQAISNECQSCTGEECDLCTYAIPAVKKKWLSGSIMSTHNWLKDTDYPSAINEAGLVREEAKTLLFASSNWENLSQDIAKGNGEFLSSLATLWNVPERHQTAFFLLAQNRYMDLARKGEVKPDCLLGALEKSLAEIPLLTEPSQIALK
jgi:Protein of unknown function (DUF3015)